MCATASYTRVQDGRTSTTRIIAETINDKVTDGELNMKRQSKYVDRRKFDFRKNYNARSVFGHIFLKTAANGHFKVTHS